MKKGEGSVDVNHRFMKQAGGLGGGYRGRPIAYDMDPGEGEGGLI